MPLHTVVMTLWFEIPLYFLCDVFPVGENYHSTGVVLGVAINTVLLFFWGQP